MIFNWIRAWVSECTFNAVDLKLFQKQPPEVFLEISQNSQEHLFQVLFFKGLQFC